MQGDARTTGRREQQGRRASRWPPSYCRGGWEERIISISHSSGASGEIERAREPSLVQGFFRRSTWPTAGHRGKVSRIPALQPYSSRKEPPSGGERGALPLEIPHEPPPRRGRHAPQLPRGQPGRKKRVPRSPPTPARRPNHCGSAPPPRLHKQPRDDVSLRRLQIPPPSAATMEAGAAAGRSGAELPLAARRPPAVSSQLPDLNDKLGFSVLRPEIVG